MHPFFNETAAYEAGWNARRFGLSSGIGDGPEENADFDRGWDAAQSLVWDEHDQIELTDDGWAFEQRRLADWHIARLLDDASNPILLGEPSGPDPHERGAASCPR